MAGALSISSGSTSGPSSAVAAPSSSATRLGQDGPRMTKRRPAPAHLTLAPPALHIDPNSRSAPNSPVRSMTSDHVVSEPVYTEAKELSNTLRGTPRRRPSMPFKPNLSLIPPSNMASASTSYPSPLSSTQAALRARPDAYRDPSEHILSGRGSTLQHARSVYAAGPIEILPGVWLGDEHNARDAETISDLGITTILNVAKETTLPFQSDPDSIPMRLSRQEAGPIISASGRGGVPIPPAPASASLVAEGNRDKSSRSPNDFADVSTSEERSDIAGSSRSSTLKRLEDSVRSPVTPATALYGPTDFYTPPSTATFPRSSAAKSPLIPGAYPPFTPLEQGSGAMLSLFSGLKRAALSLRQPVEASRSPKIGDTESPGSASSNEHPTFVRSTASTPNLKTAYNEGVQSTGSVVSPMTLTQAQDVDTDACGYSSGVSSSRPSTSTATTRSDDGVSSSTSSPSSSSSSAFSHKSRRLGVVNSHSSEAFTTPKRFDAPLTDAQDIVSPPLTLPPSIGSSVPLPSNAIALTVPASPLSGRLQALRYIKLPWTHDEMSLAAPDGGFAQGCAIIAEALGIRAIEDESTVDESSTKSMSSQGSDTERVSPEVAASLQRKPGGVLVHCQCGVSRSATLVIAFVMQAAALGYDFADTRDLTGMHDCYSFVKDKSSSISPNCSLIYQLVEWERHLSSEANRLRDYLEAQARAAGIEDGSAIDGAARSVPGTGARWAGEAMDEEEWTRMRREEEKKEAEEEEKARQARLDEGIRLATEKKLARERELSSESTATADSSDGAEGAVGALPALGASNKGLGARRRKFTPSLSLGVQGNTAATDDALRQLGQAPLKTGRPVLSLSGVAADSSAGGTLRAKTPRSAKPAALLSASLAKPLEGLTLEAGPVGGDAALPESVESQEVLRDTDEELLPVEPLACKVEPGEETPVARTGSGAAERDIATTFLSQGAEPLATIGLHQRSIEANDENISPTTTISPPESRPWDGRAPGMLRQGSAPLVGAASPSLPQTIGRERAGSSSSVGSSDSSRQPSITEGYSVLPAPSPLATSHTWTLSGPNERSASVGTLTTSVARRKSHRLSSPTHLAARRGSHHHIMQGITASLSQQDASGWQEGGAAPSPASSSATNTPQTARSPSATFAFPARGASSSADTPGSVPQSASMSRRGSSAQLLLHPSASFGANRLTPEQRRSEHKRTFSNDWPVLGKIGPGAQGTVTGSGSGAAGAEFNA